MHEMHEIVYMFVDQSFWQKLNFEKLSISAWNRILEISSLSVNKYLPYIIWLIAYGDMGSVYFKYPHSQFSIPVYPELLG